jgi:hypothetical protein
VYDPDVLTILRAAIGFTLAVAAVAKLLKIAGPTRFAVDLFQIEEAAAKKAVVVVSLVEGLLGFLLIAGVATTAAALMTNLLLGGFVATQLWHARTGGEAGCRCFGALDEQVSSRLALTRVTVLFVSSAVLTILAVQHSVPCSRAPGATVVGGAVAVALILAFAEAGAIGGFRKGVRAMTGELTGT